jgi:hypothetical protein
VEVLDLDRLVYAEVLATVAAENGEKLADPSRVSSPLGECDETDRNTPRSPNTSRFPLAPSSNQTVQYGNHWLDWIFVNCVPRERKGIL